MTSQVAAFLAGRWCVPASSLDVELQPLVGGLESMVARARIASAQVAFGGPRDLVVKQLSGPFAREADVYDALWKHLKRPPAVQMFGRDVCGDATYLYLEHAVSFSEWPWSNTGLSASVCRELAQLHDAPSLSGEAFSWNYEEELIRSAENTLGLAATAAELPGPTGVAQAGRSPPRSPSVAADSASSTFRGSDRVSCAALLLHHRRWRAAATLHAGGNQKSPAAHLVPNIRNRRAGGITAGGVTYGHLNEEGCMARTFAATIITDVEFVNGDSSDQFDQTYLKHLTDELEKAASQLSLRMIKDVRVTFCAGGVMRPA